MSERNFAHQTKRATARSAQASQPGGGGGQVRTATGSDLLNHIRQYASENPEIAAAWCFGLGFVLGWRLKPW